MLVATTNPSKDTSISVFIHHNSAQISSKSNDNEAFKVGLSFGDKIGHITDKNGRNIREFPLLSPISSAEAILHVQTGAQSSHLPPPQSQVRPRT